jgi:branched-chain amino acid transport system permease protein
MAADILVLASIYVLIALGYVIVYRTSRVLNFAHGEIFMIGGYLVFSIVAALHLDPFAVVPISLASGAIIGVLTYFALMAPMAGHAVFAAVLLTIALGTLIRSLALAGYSGQIVYPGRVLGVQNEAFNLLPGLHFTLLEIYLVISAVVATALLLMFFRYSSIGIRMRAASEDQRLAAYRGINIHALFALAWGIATAIAMYTGALYSLNQQVNPALSEIAIRGLAVALVGGMDSIKGVVPAALLIAALEVLTQHYISTQASDAVPFVLLIIVLLVRPWGFLGTKEAIDRV